MRVSKKVKKNTLAGKGGLAGRAAGLKQAGLITLPLLALLILSYSGYALLKAAFPLKQVTFSGNRHLSDEDLRGLTGLGEKENLAVLSSSSVYANMAASPWIRSVSIRKEFPGTLHVLIAEAEPFALLEMGGRHFIVDNRGRMLEELRDSSIPFLPVIVGNPFDRKEAYEEAISLVKTIRETGLLSAKDRIEVIANRPQDIAVNLDGVVVKVGTGEYQDKLVRLLELEDEIRERNIPVDYIDLRFANRVVVKPVSEVTGR